GARVEAVAENVTVVPTSKVVEHAGGQEMPGGWLVTVPVPATVTLTGAGLAGFGVISTAADAVAVRPFANVACTITWYVCGAAQLCDGDRRGAVAPSPKLHNALIGGRPRTAFTVNEMSSPTCAPARDIEICPCGPAGPSGGVPPPAGGGGGVDPGGGVDSGAGAPPAVPP